MGLDPVPVPVPVPVVVPEGSVVDPPVELVPVPVPVPVPVLLVVLDELVRPSVESPSPLSSSPQATAKETPKASEMNIGVYRTDIVMLRGMGREVSQLEVAAATSRGRGQIGRKTYQSPRWDDTYIHIQPTSSFPLQTRTFPNTTSENRELHAISCKSVAPRASAKPTINAPTTRYENVDTKCRQHS